MMYNNSPNLPPQHSAAAGQVVATNNSPNDYFNRAQTGKIRHK